MKKVEGYVGHLEVTAFPDSEIPHYIVHNDGFTTNVNILVKKGTYVGTVEFTNFKKEIIKVKEEKDDE